jgi:hypothetical protein
MGSKRWALAWTGLILLLTLSPAPPSTALPEDLPAALCLVCGYRGGADGILNVLLFLPLGFALTTATAKPLRVVGLVFGLSLGIEVLQEVIPGRYAGLGDIVYNTVGGGIGVGLAAFREQLLRPGRRLAGALTLGTGAMAGAVFLLTGALLTPSFPDTMYYGQWTADLRFMEAYGGRVLDARLGSMFLGSERASDPELAVDLMRSGAPLRAEVVAGPAPPALAPIVSIFDESSSEILVLGADDTDFVLRVRYRADDLRLDRPDLRVRRAFAGIRPGDTLSLGEERTREGYSLRLDQREYARLRHTPGEGWALLLHPDHTAAWVDHALDIAWVAGLLILVGWWAPGLGWAAGALVLALAGMVMAAVVGPLMGVATAEILAAFGGVALGRLVRRSWRRGRTARAGYASVKDANAKERALI